MHEGGVTITADAEGCWAFTKPDGRRCEPWVSDDNLARPLAFALRRNTAQFQPDRLAAVDSFHHPKARTIRPGWSGEPFDLHACVKPSSPSDSPSPRAILINKGPSEGERCYKLTTRMRCGQHLRRVRQHL